MTSQEIKDQCVNKRFNFQPDEQMYKFYNDSLCELHGRIPKFLKIMKLVTLLIFGAIIQISAKSFAQTITLQKKDVSLKEIFEEIREQTGYDVLYQPNVVNDNTIIHADFEKTPLKEVLGDCLQGQNLIYTIEDKTIVIRKQPFQPEPAALADTTITVQGTVKEKGGGLLPDVTVRIKGTNQGTTTDASGKYTLVNMDRNAILEISYLGYQTQDIPINGRSILNVAMNVNISTLNQLVVVGYGTQKKGTLSGAIASVKGSEIIKSPAINLSNSLAGRIAGLTVIGQGGEPGNDYSTILVRGINTFQNSSPLFVVDGVPLQNSDMLQHIDPSIIESVTVLKDASAAIYGSEGANGVILITTKRGKAGKMVVSATFNQGESQPTILPKMLNSYQIATWQNEAMDMGYQTGTLTLHPGKYSVYELAGYLRNNDPWNYPNTNWISEMIRPWAPQSYTNINMSGGSDKLRALVSVSDRSQDGFFKHGSGKFNQYDLNSNMDINPSKYILFSVDLNGQLDKTNFPVSDAGTIFSQTITAPPSRVAYWPNGILGQPTDPTGQSGSPVAIGTPLAGYNDGDNYDLNGTAKLNIKVPWVDGLSFTGTGTIDRTFYNSKYWSIPIVYNQWDGQSKTDPAFTQITQGDITRTLSVSQNIQKNYRVNFLANYEKQIGEHYFKLLLGYEQFERAGNMVSTTRKGFDANNLDQLTFGSSANEVISQNNPGASRWQNYLGRLNYNFDSKLFFEFLFRYQGSSIFYQSNRWGFFPGGSIAYKISEENFWKKNIHFMNDFKLRASYGITGNDLVPPFQYLSLYQQSPFSYVEQVGPNGPLTELSTLQESVAAYQNATWEKAYQLDIGMDAEMFDSKVSVTYDYFRNKRTDILTPLSGGLPASTGIIPPDQNLGRFLNRGFDFNVTYQDNTHEFTYSISLNGLYAKNKYLYFDEVAGIPKYQQQTGHPIGSGLYYKVLGIFRTPADLKKYPAEVNGQAPQLGDLIFADVNHDGIVNSLDMVRSYKSNVPVWSGGVNFSFGYKNFDLSILFQGALGAVMYLRPNFSLNTNYLVSFYTDGWSPNNVNGSFPKFFSGASTYWSDPTGVFNTFFLHNTNYARLKNMEIGYTFPNKLTEKIDINKIRVYVNGMNLYTICPGLKGWYTDPEEAIRSQFYGESYPLQRIVNFGINVTF